MHLFRSFWLLNFILEKYYLEFSLEILTLLKIKNHLADSGFLLLVPNYDQEILKHPALFVSQGSKTQTIRGQKRTLSLVLILALTKKNQLDTSRA